MKEIYSEALEKEYYQIVSDSTSITKKKEEYNT